jgi:hypothetical protein
MTTPDVTIQLERLDQRLAEVEASLHRLERLLLSQPAPQLDQLSQQARPLRFVSPRLRHREQAIDFVMVVTRDTADAGL